jgi:hypothetical protein
LGKKYLGKKYLGKKYLGKKYLGKKYQGKNIWAKISGQKIFGQNICAKTQNFELNPDLNRGADGDVEGGFVADGRRHAGEAEPGAHVRAGALELRRVEKLSGLDVVL